MYRNVVVCDLDGCLSDDRWRRHWLPAVGAADDDYDAYHEHHLADKPVPGVADELMRDLRGSSTGTSTQENYLLIVTARPEKYRRTTQQWVRDELPGVKFTVLMRPPECTFHSPALKQWLIAQWLSQHSHRADGWTRVIAAYDDRQDVLDAYPISDDRKKLRTLPYGSPETPSGLLAKAQAVRDAAMDVPAILQSMASTFQARNAVYGSNYMNVAPVIKVLWPDGVPSALVTTTAWHLFELIVVKMTRFAVSGLRHRDSIHDIAVYAAMIEAIIAKEERL